MKIEIWSDVVCPFCYIGKRKLEKALEESKKILKEKENEGAPSTIYQLVNKKPLRDTQTKKVLNF